MKQLTLILFICTMGVAVQAKDKSPKGAEPVDSAQMALDAYEQALNYKTGTVTIGDNLAQINVPAGFRFLDRADAESVIYELWGNPRGEAGSILGLLVPTTHKITAAESWAFVIQYDPMGYVKDDDADKINYDDLLKDMQSSEAEENKERTQNGFEAVHIVGWAQKPYYDKERKVLHWAKEIAFGSNPEHTLNYNIRILGRTGVLVLNAVGGMNSLGEINQQVSGVLSSVSYAEGNRYADFNPSVDKVAAWSIGGLVAGKVLAKAGIFAFLAKFAKVIFVAVAAGGAAVWNWFKNRFRGQSETEEVAENEETA